MLIMVQPCGLRADPAGFIDLSVLDESARIAPRWRSNEALALETIGIGEPARQRNQADVSPTEVFEIDWMNDCCERVVIGAARYLTTMSRKGTCTGTV
jgi:hypothetical protein